MSNNRRRIKSSRIQTIIEICKQNQDRNTDDKAPAVLIPDAEKSNVQLPTSSKFNQFATETELVNSIYSIEQTRTSSLFQDFSETETSQNCLPNLATSTDFDLLFEPNNASILKIPFTSVTETENNIELNDIEVTEIMGLMSSNSDIVPDRHSSNSIISIDQTDPLKDYSFTRQTNASQLDFFSSDDSVKDANYSPDTTDSDDSEKENFTQYDESGIRRNWNTTKQEYDEPGTIPNPDPIPLYREQRDVGNERSTYSDI
ncbi:uncharacterized protein LOC125241903 [Leguminivora glycinivorella]|uniref:uncharacterized protein LOC125241903 n=1 Tax=Leguminivora glycinivorella TaxID=1035111 RepID=UPI00200BFC55|nr:uncharacterized protein LOC125241903 [Leguminivora glycinivorella]